MQIVVAVAALLLLAIVLLPIVARRFRLARRERAVHLDGGCHWYANYDEDLRYEPQSRSDIVRLPREDVLHRGYLPTEEVQAVPRTFRHRVPGDVKIRLWKNGSPDSRPLWLCEWAVNPVRVAIGVGDRETVPGVESGRVPTVAGLPPDASPPPLDPGEWVEALADEASGVGDAPAAEIPDEVTIHQSGGLGSSASEVSASDGKGRGRSKKRRRRR